jgi:hypothetical protein
MAASSASAVTDRTDERDRRTGRRSRRSDLPVHGDGARCGGEHGVEVELGDVRASQQQVSGGDDDVGERVGAGRRVVVADGIIAERGGTEIPESRHRGQVTLTAKVQWLTFPNDIPIITISGH